jgi:DNA mismatch repair protein MutL
MAIRVLPENLINKIAAGEVIEDPLSIVKEFIENSIDAGSTCIEVELLGGGHRLIRVSDDGCGMAQDDAVLCFERHATSKIRSSEDLFDLHTMGFRGEALASIAAVGKVELKTAVKDKMGTVVEIHGGKLLRVLPCQRAQGTTIEVRDLFFSTPARRKFQKSPEVSSAKIEKWLAFFSLGYPNVQFSLKEENKHLDFQSRIEMVFGPQFSHHHLKLDAKKDGICVQGLLGQWSLHRPQRSGQVVFVNGRVIDAPLVSFTIRQAYATRLPEGRHPLFFLNLRLPANSIDVNVHPQKKEIRFSEESYLKNVLQECVSEALDQKNSSHKPIYASFEKRDQIPWVFSEEIELKRESQEELPIQTSSAKILALIWQYILLDTLEIVDLQKAVERILFEKKSAIDRVASEPLLIPVHLNLSRFEAGELRKKKDLLENMGFKVAELGEKQFCVEGIPQGMEAGKIHDVLIELISEAKEEHYPRIFKKCIKRQFSLEEAQGIYKALMSCAIKDVSPTGEPIVARLEENVVAACFKRESKRS